MRQEQLQRNQGLHTINLESKETFKRLIIEEFNKKNKSLIRILAN